MVEALKRSDGLFSVNVLCKVNNIKFQFSGRFKAGAPKFCRPGLQSSKSPPPTHTQLPPPKRYPSPHN